MKAWLKVVGLGLSKLPMKIAAPVAYFFIEDKNKHPIFGVQDATDLSWWNIGVRNSVHNMYNKPAVEYETTGNTDDETLENLEGIQWRRRESKDGKYVSFRVTWGKPNKSKGKYEFYIGWTMSELPRMRLSFFQLRATWYQWLVGVAAIAAPLWIWLH